MQKNRNTESQCDDNNSTEKPSLFVTRLYKGSILKISGPCELKIREQDPRQSIQLVLAAPRSVKYETIKEE